MLLSAGVELKVRHHCLPNTSGRSFVIKRYCGTFYDAIASNYTMTDKLERK
jgi:hypothetical protein